MICSIENNANGRKSELREELLTVLKNEASATMAYARATGVDFKEKFGDWEDAFKNPDKGIETGNVSPTGEPILYHKKGTNQHYYILKDKTKEFIDKEGLRGSFSTKNIADINSYLLHQYTAKGKLKSLNEFEDTQSNSKNIAEVIQKAIDDYKIEMDLLEDEDVRAEYLTRIALVESYRNEFREELIYSIQSLGEKIREVAEEDKGGGINITESTTVNPKTSASINTKIFLSQILDQELSDTPNDINIYPFNDGSYDIENLEGEVIGEAPNKEAAIALGFELSKTKEPGYDSKKSDYLNTEAFLPLDNVIKVLWPMLSDMVTTGSSQDVSSAYQKMYAKINEMKPVYPWMEGLMEKLDHLEKYDRNKLFEFVQTFSKTKINYYVTEFSQADNTYKIINATSTNSKESIILDKWGYSFDKKFLGEQSHMGTDAQGKVKDILDNILVIQKEYNATLKLAGSDRVELSKVFTESSVSLTKEMKALGIFDVDPRDFNNLILLSGGTENAEQTFSQLFSGFEFLRKGALANGKAFKENGDSINPFRSESVFRDFAKAASVRDIDTSDANVLANDNKNYFVYANPSYVSNKVSEWIADPSELIEMSNDPYNKNSRWAKWLLGTEINRTEKERKAKSLARMEKFKAGLASSFKSKQKNDGVDNTKISFEDQLNDNITKMLGAKIKGGKSYFPTIVAADKSRRIEFEGLPMFNAGISGSLDDVKIHEKSINLLLGYFTDEYNRMMKVKRENAELDDNQKVVHYHGADGNGKKSQLFPEFNHDSTDPDFLELREQLYNSNGEPHSEDDSIGGLSEPQKVVLKKAIKKSLESRILETHKKLSGMNGLNSSLVKAYDNPISMAGDYLMNGIISNVEYTKMFSGDPAYYKSMPDLIKRVPATYSDGLQLALHSEDQLRFNMATVTGVEVSSRYVDKIRASLKDKSIADAYGKVNTTDAQAWITPRRWRFLKQRLGQWSPKHDVVFNSMMTGKELRPDQLKLAAQPMKGVYFERNNNVPTYLKYSQAVLIPDLVKGTPMEKLYDKMTSDADGNRYGDKDAHKEIHEVVTIDGVKVGAIAPTSINKEGTTEMLEDFELNKIELSNKGWKLQQDLPVKTMHETNLGSQIQKTILESLGLKEDYLLDGKKVKGAALLQKIHESISALSNIGKEEVSKKLGIVGDKITDKSALYEVLIAEFKDRGGNENIIAALEKEFAFDAIPQIRGRVDSILMSIFNKAITKISTEGGSYIQVSPFGLETILDESKPTQKSKASKSGIKIVSEDYNGKGLLPPRRGSDGQTLPGQAMIPHSLAMKILKESGIDSRDITDWKGVFTPKALEIISYRIPNQGMSSNDTLQIVGILPAGMGDSIIGYDGIPAKTGSDFDIDKMFVMAPNLVYNTDTEKIEVLTMENSLYLDKDREKDLGTDENSEAIEPEFDQDAADNVNKQLAQNKVIELYSAVLQSPHTYDNMMTSIDANYLKDDIVGLFPKPAEQNLTFFSPINQLQTKMDYMSGKAGVGMTANQLVDHVSNQSLNIYLNTNLGFAGKGKTTSMDDPKKGISIATSLSAFLNAYVDIAKDPYISRGNHNEVTANVGFMLIRAGMDTKMLNRFIGQPILREYVEIVRRKNSITGAPLMHNGKLMEPAEYLMAKRGIKTDVSATARVGKLSQAELEESIKDPSFIDNNGTILNAFIKLEADGKKFAEAVSAAKSDTKGSGGSPIDMIISRNKIQNVIEGRFVMGYESKFINTALGTYRKNSLNWVAKVLDNSQILLSGSTQYENTLNRASVALGKGPYMTSATLAKEVDGAIYSYLMADTELFKNNRTDFKKLFLTLPETIGQMKIDKTDNFLVKELEIQRRGGYAFIGINNKNKPVDYQNNIYRAWMDLYRDPGTKELAMDLAKYAYTQSGFQPNLNQFFTYMPHEVLKDSGFNSDVIKMYDKLNVVANSNDFIDQFSRHNSSNPQIVPSLNLSFNSAAEELSAASGFIGEPMSEADAINGKLHPVFVSRGPLGDPMLFKAITMDGSLMPALNKDGAPMYIRTFKLGYKAGKNKIFEYSYENKLKSSVVQSNNLSDNPYLKKQIKEKYTTFMAMKPGGLDIDFHAGLEDHLNKYAAENISDEESQAKSVSLTPEQIAAIIKKKNIKEEGCE
jgi:hypothetical protein